MVGPDVELWDVKPLTNAPSSKLLNELASQLVGHIGKCRSAWWKAQQTVCLDNQSVFRSENGKVYSGAGAEQGIVAAGTGRYEKNTVRASIVWADGHLTVEEICG